MLWYFYLNQVFWKPPQDGTPPDQLRIECLISEQLYYKLLVTYNLLIETCLDFGQSCMTRKAEQYSLRGTLKLSRTEFWCCTVWFIVIKGTSKSTLIIKKECSKMTFSMTFLRKRLKTLKCLASKQSQNILVKEKIKYPDIAIIYIGQCINGIIIIRKCMLLHSHIID